MKLRTILIGAVAFAVLPACADISGSTTCQVQIPTTTQLPADTVGTSVGLKYLQTQAGTGTVEVGGCDAVNVEVTGELLDGTVFQPKTSVQYIAGSTQLRIAGLSIGVYGMKEGGVRRLIIPPSLGFGEEAQFDRDGNLVVPANSTLVMDVRLISLIDR